MQIYGSKKAVFWQGVDLRGMGNAFLLKKTGDIGGCFGKKVICLSR
jgi:hypothetical protein